MKLIDHTDPNWTKLSKAFGGAYTYSADIVKYQVPKWEKVLGAGDVVSTAPMPQDATIEGRFRTAIWYLHKYPFGLDPTAYVRDALQKCTAKFKRIIFVTAYKEYCNLLLNAGLKAVYIPMAIDVAAVKQFKGGIKTNGDRFIYFGNVYKNKRPVFDETQKLVEMDFLSYRRFNGVDAVPAGEATYKLISQYKYGIGVGRCALEMWALGLKVVVSGRQFGGLVTTEAEYETQMSTNTNGRLWTYSCDVARCFRDIDKSIVPEPTDIAKIDHVAEVRKFYRIP